MRCIIILRYMHDFRIKCTCGHDVGGTTSVHIIILECTLMLYKRWKGAYVDYYGFEPTFEVSEVGMQIFTQHDCVAFRVYIAPSKIFFDVASCE